MLHLLHGFAQPPMAWDAVRAHLRTPAMATALPPMAGAAGWNDAIDRVARQVPTDAIVVGYSLGARVALGLLARDRIAAAIFISMHPGLEDDAARADRRAADAAWSARLRTGADFLDAWEAQPIFATAARADAAARAARRAARAALDPHALADVTAAPGLAAVPSPRAALPARADRARLVVGADDAKFTALAAALAAAAPALGPTVIPGSGHDPTLEQPAALAAALDDLAAALAR